ncbi:MAG: winged helix-turn-helix transcriptional regulator [Alphaproteobacteria bacterium]|nr:winged helix-turn-helix transcriptional regulator [Alphaproteobacteria bacterium]
MKLDDIDIKILDCMQDDASLSVAEIAEKVGLTASPCWRRIRNLEADGVIRKRMAILEDREVGLDFQAVVMVKIAPPTRNNHAKFMNAVQSIPEIVEALTISGEYDYLLRVMTPDMTSYNNFIGNRLLPIDVIGANSSAVILKKVKMFNGVPLNHLTQQGKLHNEPDF